MHKILLVDDSNLVHSFVDNVCKEQSFKLLHAKNIKECDEILKSEKISVILLDVVLKDENGFDYCVDLKKSEYSHIPIIFLTGKTEAEHIVNGFKVGASDYISKPFEKEELLARLNSQLHLIDIQKKLLGTEKLKSINAMVATYNHELNNPLQIALMSLSALKKHVPEDAKAHVEKLNDSLERVLNIVKKIQNIQEVESEEYGSSAKTINLKD